MDEVAWVLWIQRQINTTWRPNPAATAHPISYPAEDWIQPLTEEVQERVLERCRGGDENIGIAMVVSYILATWAGRIARAKSFDPRRPVELRKGAYAAWLAWVRRMNETLVDESLDPSFFEQPWESPFLPDATDGDFV